jgi:hypothetical protein
MVLVSGLPSSGNRLVRAIAERLGARARIAHDSFDDAISHLRWFDRENRAFWRILIPVRRKGPWAASCLRRAESGEEEISRRISGEWFGDRYESPYEYREKHIRDAERVGGLHMPHLYIPLSRLVRDPEGEGMKIARFINLPWVPFPDVLEDPEKPWTGPVYNPDEPYEVEHPVPGTVSEAGCP